MAEMQGLYFGMGIDTSQLHSDFVNAEKTINQNLRRINQEMEMIQLHGQLELEGLDESASQLEKVRIQEAALTEQINLQQDKILLLNKTYEYLRQTRGENAEVSRQVELQLKREEYAMQQLEEKMAGLSNQTKTVFDVNLEMLGLIEPVFKQIEQRAAAGLALPLALAPAQAKVAAGGLIFLASAIKGTADATEELREANPAQLVDEDLQRLSGSIDNSWQRINESNRRGMEQYQAQYRAYNNRPYYQNNYYNRQNQYNPNYNNAVKAQTEQNRELEKTHEHLKEIQKDQEGILENFAKAVGVKDSSEGGLKILPDINRNDIVRFSKVLEDYRFSEGFSSAIDLMHESDSVIGKLASTLVTFWYATSKAQAPIAEFAETVIDNFRELSKAATELNLPLDQANEILTKINLAGADYNDVRDYVRGVQDAVIKGDSEDPEVLALEKYGVTIQDTQGKLLAFDETLERLYQGYLKAREAGEAEAYVMMTNGQSVHDVLPYFENLAKAEEDMAKIKWATLDSATLNNVSREMKLFETQTHELSNALSSVFAPAAEMAFKNMFEDQKDLTELIEDNREKIIYWSYVVMEALETVKDLKKEFAGGLKESFEEAYEALKDLNQKFGLTDMLESFFADDPKKEIGEEAKEYFIPFYQELKKVEEEFGLISKLEHFLPEGFTAELDNATNEYLVPFYEKIKSIEEEFSITSKLKNAVSDLLPNDFLFGEDSIFARAQKDFEEYKKANEEARNEAEETEKALVGLSYSLNRIAKYKSELENLKLDIEFGSGDSYQKRIEQNKIWYEEAMKDAKQYANEQEIIEEVNAARLAKIEQERADKLNEIREKIAAADKTALEQKLDSIEKEKEAWISAGMEEAEAIELSEKKKLKARQEAAEKAQEYLKNAADIEYGITHTAFEKQIRDIERWKEAQQEKADTAEEVAGIIKNAAAKEAEAFEREVDRIKGTIQSLEDKIFEQEHSRYENDVRRVQQERLRYYEDFQQKGILNAETQAQIERWYRNSIKDLNSKADESRRNDGDYTKPPEGIQHGGNGIMVIEGDSIIDNGLLNAQQQEIGLIANENKIRSALSQNLSNDARETINRTQATKSLTAAQQELIRQTQQTADSIQIIEGDALVGQMPQESEGGFQLIEGDKIISGLQEFNLALQQANTEIEQFAPTQKLAEAQNEFAESFKSFQPEYFKQLADGTKAVSEMQLALTNSTMKLIDAQDKLSNAISQGDSSREISNGQVPNDGLLSLSTSTQRVAKEQELLARTTRETNERLSQKDDGIKPWFDSDVFSNLAEPLLGFTSLLATLGAIAPVPAIKAGAAILGGALGVGAAVGTYDRTHDTENGLPRQRDDNFKPYVATDLSEITKPLGAIDTNVQSILQSLQETKPESEPDEQTHEADRLQELFGGLPNIAADVQSILQEMQSPKELPDTSAQPETSAIDMTPLTNISSNVQSILQTIQTPLSFETIVTPLNNIQSAVGNILSGLSNRQPPQININPNNNINLGGAYVFDNEMKKTLVDDITSQIVDKITSAVQKATSRTNYGYSA